MNGAERSTSRERQIPDRISLDKGAEPPRCRHRRGRTAGAESTGVVESYREEKRKEKWAENPSSEKDLNRKREKRAWKPEGLFGGGD